MLAKLKYLLTEATTRNPGLRMTAGATEIKHLIELSEQSEAKIQQAFIDGQTWQKQEDIKIIRQFFSNEFENVLDIIEDRINE